MTPKGPKYVVPRALISVILFAIAPACVPGQIAMDGSSPSRPSPGSGSPTDPGNNAPGETKPPGSAPGNTDKPGPATPPPPAAPAVGQRMTDRQFLNVLLDVFGVDASADAAALPLDPKIEGFRNAAVALLPSDLRVEGYASLAGTVAGKIDWGKLMSGGGLCADFNDKCPRDFVASIGRRLFRRPLTDAQIARFTGIFAVVKQENDPFSVATGLVVTAMLQSPEFLYRLERGTGKQGEDAKVDDYDVATRLSFLLWNSVPDEALLAAAGKNELSGAGLKTQVDRMIGDARAHRALRDYVDDWLDAERLLRTSRDTDMFPQFTGALASEMREEIHRLFERVVWQDDADMIAGLLKAEKTQITPALAGIYGLSGGQGDAVSEMSLANQANRQGLLTQPGILTLTSVGGKGSSIVDRGVFLLRNLLCLHIPEPPSNVPELPPGSKGLSERDRLAEHRKDAACAACHNQIDPLGLAFETYDAIGRFQSEDEAGNKLTGAGTLSVGGKDVAYTNVREFIGALSQSPALAQCMVRKIAQYTLARPLEGTDDGMIEDLSKRFSERGNRYKALLGLMSESAWARTTGVTP
jgi:hypothetical protein